MVKFSNKKDTKKRITALVLSFMLSIPAAGTGTFKENVYAGGYGLNNPRTNEGVSTWDCIYFGNYWQNDTNGDGTVDTNDTKEGIKWRVLSVDGDDAFILADKALDCKKYNETDTSVTWENCTLRTWLNGTFYDNAFSSSEKNAINSTEDGNNTSDNIYLLSIEEAINASYGFVGKYWTLDNRNICIPTDFAVNNGAYKYKDTSGCFWWLRSAGYYDNNAADVQDEGYVYDNGISVDSDGIAVRPVLHINLSSSVWSMAGTVSSARTITEGNYKYNVIKPGSADGIMGELAVTGFKKKSLTTANIAKQVTIDGVTYNVTSIDKNAFKGNKKIKKVIIGKNVKTIGASAFANCNKLKNVVIKSSKITSIGKKAFYRKSGKKLTIKVPKKKKNKYNKMLKKAKTNKYAVK